MIYMKKRINPNPKPTCETCNHKHYKNHDSCPQCNCGESERIYTGSWRGYNPEIAYNGFYDPYDRTDAELRLYGD